MSRKYLDKNEDNKGEVVTGKKLADKASATPREMRETAKDEK